MVAYGFRLYTISAHHSRAHKMLSLDDFSDSGTGGSAVDVLEAQLSALVDQLKIGQPLYFVDPATEKLNKQKIDADRNVPYFVVLSVLRSVRRIEVNVETGREGDYDTLRSRDGSQPLALTKRAAVRRTRVIFLIPKTGTEAIMVAETRGQSSGGEQLVNWLSRVNHRDAITIGPNDDVSEGDWVRWSAKPMFDGSRIEDILVGASEFKITLKQKGYDAAGNPVDHPVILNQLGLRQSKSSTLKNIFAKWWQMRQTGTPKDRNLTAAGDVLTLLDDSVSGLEFDEAEVSFNENGKHQTVNPNTIDRLFVYPLGSAVPSTPQIRRSAADVLVKILPALGIEADLSLR